MSTELDKAYNWDDTIENDGSDFTLLPAGEYPFTVVKFERARFEGSDKIPPCNQANVSIEIDGGVLGKTVVVEKLKLHSKVEWLLCAFFKSLGDRKHGEPLRMDWGKVVGKRGRCKVEVNNYKNKDGQERQNNRIKAFIEPTNGAPAASVAAAPQQATWDSEADTF